MPGAPTNNLLLASLPEALCAEVSSAGRVTSHERGDTIHALGDRIDELAFPLDGLVSLTVDTSEGQTVEVAITGIEGFVGVGRYLGQAVAANNAIVQTAGRGTPCASGRGQRCCRPRGPVTLGR